MKANKMREVEIEKVILSIGAVSNELEKAAKLLKLISGMQTVRTKARKRIPAFGIRPGLEIGVKVTLRGKKAEEILKKLLASVNNQLKTKQINDEDLSFGIEEYIEIPGIEYQRDIGMIGLNVSVIFKRKGKRIEIKKRRKGKIPKRQKTTKQEIIELLNKKFNTEIVESKK